MQTSVRLPMQSSVRCNLCQTGLTVFLHNLSLSGLLFKEGDDVSPTFLIYINCLHRDLSERGQCLHLEDVASLFFVVCTALDLCGGTRWGRHRGLGRKCGGM
jgi:hypothetical protein